MAVRYRALIEQDEYTDVEVSAGKYGDVFIQRDGQDASAIIVAKEAIDDFLDAIGFVRNGGAAADETPEPASFKVGDEVWVRGSVMGVDRSDTDFPVCVAVRGNGRTYTHWFAATDVRRKAVP